MKKLVRLFIVVGLMVTAFANAKDINQTSDIPKRLTQEPQHGIAVERIVNRLLHSHYVRFSLNDKLSERIFDRYLDRLDPRRILFLQTDIDRFTPNRTNLHNELTRGKLDTAYELFTVIQQRYQEQVRYSLDLLKEPMTLDDNTVIELDRSQQPWPTSQTEQYLLWHSIVKNDVINLKLSGKEWPEIKTTLTKRYTIASQQHQLTNSEDVFNLFINAFTATLDPHTNYLSPNDTANFMTMMNLSLEGIGATLALNEGYIEVMSLIANGPAAKSKQLHVGDRIIGVAQGDKTMVDVVGWRLDDVIALIKGPKGTKVRLEVISQNSKKSRIITLTREEIKFEDSKAKKEIKTVNGRSVGVITIPSFYIGVAQDTELLLRDLSRPNIEAVVIDLRMNGGGSLAEVVHLSDLFLPQAGSPIVQVRTSDGRIKVYSKNNINVDSSEISLLGINRNKKKYYYDKPAVVLVNRLSVSASEIFAAAMQDYARAVIVGENTFGKGTVQESVGIGRIYDDYLFPDWKPFGSLRYTNQKFYRVSGGSTQLRGVEPDLLMSSALAKESKLGERYENNALPWDKIKPAKFSKVNNMQPYLPELQLRHERRLTESPDYQFLLQYIRLTQQNQRTLSLNYAQRERDANADDRVVIEYINSQLQQLGRRAVSSLNNLPKDYQLPDTTLNEAVLVALDLAGLQR